MSSDNNPAYGQQGDDTHLDPNIAMRFMVQQMLGNMQTVALVKVIRVSSPGGLAPVGMVDVQPLVHQMTGNREAVPHGIIYGIPYMRLQGGSNAVILDPQPGDIGMCGFCSRDSSSAIANKGFANPNTYRRFDWSDGLYFGGFLNAAPQQYVQFADEGIRLVSPNKVILQAPDIEFQGAVTASSTIAAQGDISTQADIRAGSVSLKSHVHSKVQTGGGNTDVPVTTGG